MPIPPELRKKLEEKGIVGFSDPNGRTIRVYCETEEDAKRILMEMPEIKIAGVSIKTEPIVSGRFYALGALKSQQILASRTERIRPILGGISIGNYKITAGTLGIVIIDKITGKPVILSNNHILTQIINGIEGEINDPILQPAAYDHGTEEDMVGRLLRFVTIKLPPEANLVDCALATCEVDFKENEILDIGKIVGIGKAEIGERIFKSGRTTELTESTLFDDRATIKVWGYYSPDTYAIFEDQLISSTAFMQGGDSGSIWVNERNEVIGLGFAGSDKLSCANKIEHVLNLLNVQVPRVAVTMGVPVLLGLALIPNLYLLWKK
jgi:hypothetical protein